MKRWSEEEDKVIVDSYARTYSRAGKNSVINDIHKILPHRSRASIKARARHLDVASKWRHWTDEEEKVLIEMFNSCSLSEVQDALKGRRTLAAIRVRACHLGLTDRTPREWEEDEIKLLESLLDSGVSYNEITTKMHDAGYVDRYKASIKQKVSDLELRHPGSLTIGGRIKYIAALEKLCRRSAARAREHSIPIDDDLLEQVIALWHSQSGRCAYSGIDMVADPSEVRNPLSVSIDQIHPGGGYVSGNVHLVCMRVNLGKRNGSHEDELAFWEKVKK